MKQKNRFKKELFTRAVKDKLYSEMLIKQSRISLDVFSKQTGVSKATLSRVTNGKMCDLETYFRLCFWMKRSANEFYEHDEKINMKTLILKELSRKRAIRLAELAFASKIKTAYLYYDEDESVLYVFVDKVSLLNDNYVKKYGLTHVKNKYDFMEIDSSFNVQINFNNMCNVALIYQLIFHWGYFPDKKGTGLFP